jgi:two-component system, NarL family, invasion response regulator UvrY
MVVLAPAIDGLRPCEHHRVPPGPVRVLIVDDRPGFLEAAAEVIELADGFELVASADSGEAALEVVRSQPVDLVVMDVNMPGIGGICAAGRLGAEHPEVKVVLVSTDDADSLPPRLIESGVRYLHKELLGPDELRTLWDSGGSPGGDRW